MPTARQLKACTSTIRDVAAHFGVGTTTVYRWLNSPTPPPHRRLGVLYRFNLEDVDRWAANETQRAKRAKQRVS